MGTKKTKGRPRVSTKGVRQKGRDVDNQIERTPKSNLGQAGVKPRVSRIAEATKILENRKRRRLIADKKSKKKSIDEFLPVEEWMDMIENK